MFEIRFFGTFYPKNLAAGEHFVAWA